MKVLHTADWHIGRRLYGRKRYDEFRLFLQWLSDLIIKQNVEILLISGDIFDTTTPNNYSQELYYQFLYRISQGNSCCQHIVITAGNHDSPTLLSAPASLLRSINIHVVGEPDTLLNNKTTQPSQDIITLHSPHGDPISIVCAIPYLRDKDIRRAEAGESIEDKAHNMLNGIQSHYWRVASEAAKIQEDIMATHNKYVPIIGMGHLFTAGGKVTPDDGVRDLYLGSTHTSLSESSVGNITHVGVDTFSREVDYWALGHLHSYQRVHETASDNSRTVDRIPPIYYSGSPIPMGFGESNQTKVVLIIDIDTSIEIGVGTRPLVEIEPYTIPIFQNIQRISGDLDEILDRIFELTHTHVWLEITYTGKDILGNLSSQIADAIGSNSKIEVLRIKNMQLYAQTQYSSFEHRHDPEGSDISTYLTLHDLSVKDVFQRCLDASDINPEDRSELLASYHEIIQVLNENDSNAS